VCRPLFGATVVLIEDTASGCCVQVRGAALLGQRKKLDGAGRGIHPRDRVLSAFSHPGGAVGADGHAVGRCTRPQRDQIRLASSGIEAAEFAGRLCSEPHRTRECAGSPRQSRNSSDWPMPRISVFELINSQLVFREMRVSGRAKNGKNCGDVVTFKKR
jgi:hypothetical protein